MARKTEVFRESATLCTTNPTLLDRGSGLGHLNWKPATNFLKLPNVVQVGETAETHGEDTTLVNRQCRWKKLYVITKM